MRLAEDNVQGFSYRGEVVDLPPLHIIPSIDMSRWNHTQKNILRTAKTKKEGECQSMDTKGRVFVIRSHIRSQIRSRNRHLGDWAARGKKRKGKENGKEYPDR